MRSGDLIAGLSVAGLMLPEAVAYAGIAGIAPQRAVLAAIAGALVYALAGRSRFAIVSPTSSSAAILGAALATLSADPAMRAALAGVAVAMVGVLFVLAAAFRLGSLTSFIARPVLRGFAFGLAVTIIVRQMPDFVGVDVQGREVGRLVQSLAASFCTWHAPSVATGVVAVASLLLLRRVPPAPGTLVVISAGIAASLALDLPAHGVAEIGRIDLFAPAAAIAHVSLGQAADLAAFAFAMVLVLFAESWGTMRSLALRNGQALRADRELGALGLANLAAAAVQGMPVGAGFSAGSANEVAGARSRLAGAIAALALLGAMLAAQPLIAHLPRPVLAAVVMVALTHALDPKPLARVWRLGRDRYVMLAAAIGVLAFGIVNGMLVAIALSVLLLIHRMAAPNVARLGQLGSGHDYADIARHPEAVQRSGLGIWRPSEPLFFANAEPILTSIARAAGSDPALRTVVVSLERSYELDTTSLDALLEFDAQIKALGLRLWLARVRDDVRDMLRLAGCDDLVSRCCYSVDDAVNAALSDDVSPAGPAARAAPP